MDIDKDMDIDTDIDMTYTKKHHENPPFVPVSSLAALLMSALGLGAARVIGSHFAALALDSPMSAYKASAKGAPGSSKPQRFAL